jgi:hypothetical protein
MSLMSKENLESGRYRGKLGGHSTATYSPSKKLLMRDVRLNEEASEILATRKLNIPSMCVNVA